MTLARLDEHFAAFSNDELCHAQAFNLFCKFQGHRRDEMISVSKIIHNRCF
jgi:hypothetical protein